MKEPQMRVALRRRKAIERAAIEYVGWGRDRRTDSKLDPQEHWESRTEAQNKAAISIVTDIVDEYQRVMDGGDPDLVLCRCHLKRDGERHRDHASGCPLCIYPWQEDVA